MYAKINGNKVVKFPYFDQHLQDENVGRIMVPIHDLCESYSGTEEAVKTGNSVVPVVVEEPPIFNEATEFLQYDHSSVSVQNGICKIGWKKETRVQQENIIG